jgi:hypothetical protein
MVVVQAPAPVHTPDQPLNTQPAAGVGVNVRAVPAGYVFWQVELQESVVVPAVNATLPLPLTINPNS